MSNSTSLLYTFQQVVHLLLFMNVFQAMNSGGHGEVGHRVKLKSNMRNDIESALAVR